MKLEIKSCKSWQLHTGAPLPALTLPCSKEQISQCQRKKKLVNGQKTESVNIVNKQTPLCCSEHFKHRVLWGRGRETIAVSPPKGSRCLKVMLVMATASTLRQLVFELSWPQPNGQPYEPDQIISAASSPQGLDTC